MGDQFSRRRADLGAPDRGHRAARGRRVRDHERAVHPSPARHARARHDVGRRGDGLQRAPAARATGAAALAMGGGARRSRAPARARCRAHRCRDRRRSARPHRLVAAGAQIGAVLARNAGAALRQVRRGARGASRRWRPERLGPGALSGKHPTRTPAPGTRLHARGDDFRGSRAAVPERRGPLHDL